MEGTPSERTHLQTPDGMIKSNNTCRHASKFISSTIIVKKVNKENTYFLQNKENTILLAIH